jgi:mercuric ion transport protein
MRGLQKLAQDEGGDLLYFLFVRRCRLPVSARSKPIEERKMPSNTGNRLITTGVIGSIIAIICCVTPVLIVLFGALGLAGATGYLDYVLLPAMVIFLGLIVYGGWLKRSCTVEDKTVQP